MDNFLENGYHIWFMVLNDQIVDYVAFGCTNNGRNCEKYKNESNLSQLSYRKYLLKPRLYKYDEMQGELQLDKLIPPPFPLSVTEDGLTAEPETVKRF